MQTRPTRSPRVTHCVSRPSCETKSLDVVGVVPQDRFKVFERVSASVAINEQACQVDAQGRIPWICRDGGLDRTEEFRVRRHCPVSYVP